MLKYVMWRLTILLASFSWTHDGVQNPRELLSVFIPSCNRRFLLVTLVTLFLALSAVRGARHSGLKSQVIHPKGRKIPRYALKHAHIVALTLISTTSKTNLTQAVHWLRLLFWLSHRGKIALSASSFWIWVSFIVLYRCPIRTNHS